MATPSAIPNSLLVSDMPEGQLDEVWIDLVPVLFGTGVRYFDKLRNPDVGMDTVWVVEGLGVTHLRYRVKSR